MNRRSFIQSAAAVSLAAAATGAAAHGAHKHDAHAKSASAPVAKNPYGAVQAAAAHCVTTGQSCLDHCIRLLSAGDKSMADCAKNVNQMLAFCTAVTNLAAQNSVLLPQIAKICVQAGQACADACKQHADHHAECRACYESCVKCAEECGKIAA